MKMMFFLRLNYLDMHRTYGCAANPQRTRPLCDFCGRKFCQPQKLKVHIKRMHSGECQAVGGFDVVVGSGWVVGFDMVVGSGRVGRGCRQWVGGRV
ncbi:hypothetical protein Pcinc_040128 [Petrolisthes cinctipes]|uniref:C2H2-type domain-containing protein n=1 Tax=Petrolisthes cinctipes TaxID=88211 RepID=A0AAE1BM66_PETCI|nr:hypothetical protein Pcinc_040128 [Petrolisthes cinctipes]